MKNSIYLILGLVIGVLFAEILRRPTMKRLAILEATAAEEKERFADYDRQWREAVATLPFEERMECELWEAGMRLNNWMPDADTWEDDDEET